MMSVVGNEHEALPTTRVCKVCGETKPLEDFAKAGGRALQGRAHKCKPCMAAATRKYKQAWQARNPDKKRESVKRWSQANPEKRKAIKQRYLATELGRERRNDYQRTRYQSKPLEERQAIGKANRARPDHKAKRAAYVDANRDRINELKRNDPKQSEANRIRNRDKWRALTPEQKEVENAKKRARYAANLDKYRAKGNRDAHRRRARLRGCDVRDVTDRDLRRQAERQHCCCFWCNREGLPLTLDHVVPIARGGRHAVGNLVLACESCNKSRGDMLVVEWRRFICARTWLAVA